MSRESLGFIKLEWTCPKCGNRNPGPEKTCLSCGAPQPEDVQFEQVSNEIVTEEREIEQAKIGADIHCAFCGTRNPADAKSCSQCGADLAEGIQRKSGRVVGAFGSPKAKSIACANCGAENPESNFKCAQCGAPLKAEAGPPVRETLVSRKESSKKSNIGWVIGVLGGLLILCFVGFLILSLRTEELKGVVKQVGWETYVVVEALQPVEHQGWLEDLPLDATVEACSLKVHHVQQEPAPDANKVCGTPYSVDTGSGYAEVVQDCQYEVLMDYCQYTALEWVQADTIRWRGNDYSPVWNEPQLTSEQRIGDQGVEFQVEFETDDGIYSYQFNDESLFRRFTIGSEWVLNVNALGNVVSVEPAP